LKKAVSEFEMNANDLGGLGGSLGSKCVYLVMVWLRPATKATRDRPSPRWGAEENGKKQAETGGSG